MQQRGGSDVELYRDLLTLAWEPAQDRHSLSLGSCLTPILVASPALADRGQIGPADLAGRAPLQVVEPPAGVEANERPPSVRVTPLRGHVPVEPPAVVQHLHGPLVVEDGRTDRSRSTGPPASTAPLDVEPLVAYLA